MFRHFMLVCLRGAGQVMFQNNAMTGLFFLIGIFWGAWQAGIIAVGVGAVVGLVFGTVMAYLLPVPRADIDAGLHGYNGILVGCALPTFFAVTPLLWVYVAVGAVFSTIVMLAVANVFKTWKVAAMTGPFVFTTWFLMLAAYNFTHLTITGLPHAALPVVGAEIPTYSLSPIQYGIASLKGVAQVFLINNWITGILFLVGLACSSIYAAVFGLVGSIIAVGTAQLLGANTSAVMAGLYQFSAVLTAIGLGSTFYKPNLRVLLYTVVGTVFTVVAQGALNVPLNAIGIPTLTFPFVIAAWLFLLPNIDLLPETHKQ